MNMTWECLVLLSRETTKNHFPGPKGAGHWWLSLCTMALAAFYWYIFLWHAVACIYVLYLYIFNIVSTISQDNLKSVTSIIVLHNYPKKSEQNHNNRHNPHFPDHQQHLHLPSGGCMEAGSISQRSALSPIVQCWTLLSQIIQWSSTINNSTRFKYNLSQIVQCSSTTYLQ